MIINITKYELWNALFMTPENEKTDKTRELERQLNDSIARREPGVVWIDIKDE